MNQKIKAAAIAHSATDPLHFRSGVIADFTAGAEFFQQSSGADEMAEALGNLIAAVEFEAIGYKMPITIIEARTALAKYNSFIKKEEDVKE